MQIGILYNHAAWTHYPRISRTIEAQWINACRIVRVTQQQAGFAEADIAADLEVDTKTPRALFNAAVTLSAMRRLMMTEMSIAIPDVPSPERIPAVSARILLGGRLEGFSGFVPGLFEEALVTLESERPVYILGGFGGAAELLAAAILSDAYERPKELTMAWLAEHNPELAKLLDIAGGFQMPPEARFTDILLTALFGFITKARANPAAVLKTGLSDDETRELLKTRTIATAVNLVRKGLVPMEKFRATSGLKRRGLPDAYVVTPLWPPISSRGEPSGNVSYSRVTEWIGTNIGALAEKKSLLHDFKIVFLDRFASSEIYQRVDLVG